MACKVQYTGQTKQTMMARHYGHRTEVKGGLDGLGRHFHDHYGAGLDLNKKADLARCLESFRLQVIGSVRPPSTPEEKFIFGTNWYHTFRKERRSQPVCLGWTDWKLTCSTGYAACQRVGG